MASDPYGITPSGPDPERIRSAQEAMQKLRSEYSQYIGLGREELTALNLRRSTIEEIIKLHQEAGSQLRTQLNHEKTLAAIESIRGKSAAGNQQILGSAAARNQQASLWGMRESQKQLVQEARSFGVGTEGRKQALDQLSKLKIRHSAQSISMATAEGRAAAEGIKRSAPTAIGHIAGDTGLLGSLARGSKGFMKLASAADEAGHGVKMGFGQQIASLGVEKLMGSFGPLLSNLTMASGVFSLLGGIMHGLVAAFDQSGRVGAPALMSVAQAGGRIGDSLVGIQGEAISVSQDLRDAFSAAGAGVAETALSAQVDILEEMAPAAQGAMKGMRVWGSTVKEQTASTVSMTEGLTEVAAAGLLAGMSMEDASAMGVRMQRAFGLSSKDGKDVSNVFQRMAKSAGMAGLTVNELVGSMMDMQEVGQSYSNQSRMYEQMAASIKSMGLAGNVAKAQMMAAVNTKFMGMSLGQQMGITMAAHPGMGINDAMRKYQSANSQGTTGMVGLGFENIAGTISRFGLDKKMRGSGTERFQAAQALGGIFQSEALKKSIAGGDKATMNALMNIGDKKANERVLAKLTETMKAESDAANPIVIGAKALGIQKDLVTRISNCIISIEKSVFSIATSAIIQGWKPSTDVQLKVPQKSLEKGVLDPKDNS